MTEEAAGLHLRGVSYRYAGTDRRVLQDVDLDVPAGRVLGVVGRNDAGKSTLCLVAAALAPGVIGGRLEGQVSIDGVDSRSFLPHEAAQRVGILFQNPETQLSGTAATVFEEVAFGPRNLGLPLADLVERVEEALDQLGIVDLAPRDPQRLSGGQAQLVALASVLALRPGILVLDEPTSQLDPAGTRLVGDALARLAASGRAAVLVAEHKTDLLERLADDVVVMDAGRVVISAPARDALADGRLLELGVTPPARVSISRAAAAAGVETRLAGAAWT
ncbi:MAG TPA: ABC transporter ATP-binding protein [Candidatus Limnocylindrales bacterium]|nr:ABC transporter ATP-binding protein [Candidatus Limnocylindrales bacterium]